MSGDQIYAVFIEGELKGERERRTTLEARGVSVVTQSGALVTLLAGVGALVKGITSTAPPSAVIVAVICALVFFFSAALCGTLISFGPIFPPHTLADAATMTQMRTTRRDHSEEEARSVVAHLHIGTLDSLRKGNDIKVRWVVAAQFCQILALVAVSAAVCFIVAQS
ncbi:hypothetical protein OHA72_01335 [Dactylosporangium sp. NBC_01737]|uniref:hypothetical protein n=1 Tax=Dactylosporangium sp. NBC_01737 TaxID=2975959 RepID=UPI002E1653D1|nr:hypothetical protein OHA72_01335 [Dactylosporangium sp. NBC_01737]